MSENEIPRRGLFVRLGTTALGLGYAGAVGYPVYRYLRDPVAEAERMGAVSAVDLMLADLPEKGSVLMFKFGSQTAMLILEEDGTYNCFDAKCTHLGCTVSYQKDKNRIFCACHEGIYDAKTGEVTGGPPPSPLKRFNVEEKDDRLTITRA